MSRGGASLPTTGASTVSASTTMLSMSARLGARQATPAGKLGRSAPPTPSSARPPPGMSGMPSRLLTGSPFMVSMWPGQPPRRLVSAGLEFVASRAQRPATRHYLRQIPRFRDLQQSTGQLLLKEGSEVYGRTNRRVVPDPRPAVGIGGCPGGFRVDRRGRWRHLVRREQYTATRAQARPIRLLTVGAITADTSTIRSWAHLRIHLARPMTSSS